MPMKKLSATDEFISVDFCLNAPAGPNSELIIELSVLTISSDFELVLGKFSTPWGVVD